MSMFVFTFSSACLLGMGALVMLIPLMRRFTEEGSKAGFDFYSARAGLWLFRPTVLPPSLEPLGRKIRFYSILLLWPACALFGIAWFIDR